jgi:hypothetical protein
LEHKLKKIDRYYKNKSSSKGNTPVTIKPTEKDSPDQNHKQIFTFDNTGAPKADKAMSKF